MTWIWRKRLFMVALSLFCFAPKSLEILANLVTLTESRLVSVVGWEARPSKPTKDDSAQGLADEARHNAGTGICKPGSMPSGERRTAVASAEEVWESAAPPLAGGPTSTPLVLSLDDLKQLLRDSSREGAQEGAAIVLAELQQVKRDLDTHKGLVLPRLDTVEVAIKNIQTRLKQQNLPTLNREMLEALVKKVVRESLESEKARNWAAPLPKPAPTPLPKPAPTPVKSAPPMPAPVRFNPTLKPAPRPTEPRRLLKVRAQAPCGCWVDLILPTSGTAVEQRCQHTQRKYQAWIVSTTPLVVATQAAN